MQAGLRGINITDTLNFDLVQTLNSRYRPYLIIT